MAQWVIAATTASSEMVESIDHSLEIQPDPNDSEKEQVRTVLTLITSINMDNITSITNIEPTIGLFANITSSFNGTSEIDIPNGENFGSWRLIRQELNPLDSLGGDLGKLTNEYRAYTDWTTLEQVE